MKPTINRVGQLLSTGAALTCLLLIAACSKDGGGSNPPPVQPVNPNAIVPLQTPGVSMRIVDPRAPRRVVRDSNIDPRCERYIEEYSINDEIDPAFAHCFNVEGGTSRHGRRSDTNPPVAAPRAPSPQVTSPPIRFEEGDREPVILNPIVFDPRTVPPGKPFDAAEQIGPVLIGQPSDLRDGSGDVLYYSGSGQDFLHEEIRSMLNRELDPEKKRLDAEFARGLVLTRMNIDLSQRYMSLSVLFRNSNTRTEMDFKGDFDVDNIFRAGDLNGRPYVSVQAACMDRTNDWNGRAWTLKSCQTVHIKVQDARSGVVRTAHVISRVTPANVVAEKSTLGSDNPNYNSLVQLFENSAHGSSGAQVKSMEIRTSETVNGSSTVVLSLGVGNSGPGGPLAKTSWTSAMVKPATRDTLNIPMTVLSSSYIGDFVQRANLIQNDGRGNFKIQLIVHPGQNGSREASLSLEMTRIHQPVRNMILR